MKKVISIIIVILLISTMIPLTLISVNAEPVGAWDGTVATSFASGDGTQGNPYVIATPGQLAYLSQTVNAGTTYAGQYFIVTADLDLGNNEWALIGKYNDSSAERSFRGSFDGQGHSISNFKFTAKNGTTAKQRFGLFGVAVNATLKNIKIENVTFNIANTTFGAYVGTLVAEASNCIISNIIVENTVTMNIKAGTQSYSIGGIAGRILDSNISYCINKSNTSTESAEANATSANLGGITGCTAGLSFISNSINYGNFKSKVAFKGGIVGIMGAGGGTIFKTTLENCINYGDLNSDTTNRYVGGIVGSLANSAGDYTMRNVYNNGTLTGGGADFNAGIIGQIKSVNVYIYFTNVGCTQAHAVKSYNTTSSASYNGTAYATGDNSILTAINTDCANAQLATIQALEAKILANVEVSQIAALSTNTTASIRLTEGSTGMRFTTNINSTAVSELATAGYSVVTAGTMIVPSSYIIDARGNSMDILNTLNKNENAGTYTNFLTVEINLNSGDSYFLGSIANLKTANYSLNFTAIGYITVRNTTTLDEFTVYSSTSSTRNVAAIAQAAAADTVYIDSLGNGYIFDKTVADTSEPPVNYDIYKIDSSKDYSAYVNKTGEKTLNVDEFNLSTTVAVEIRSPYTASQLDIIDSFIPVE